jgi:acyl carrier protein
MNDHLESVVRRAVARQLGVEPAVIDPFHRLDRDLHLHPLDIVLIVLAIEDSEKIELSIAHLESIETVAGLTTLLRRAYASVRHAYRPAFVPIYRRYRRAHRLARRQQEV